MARGKASKPGDTRVSQNRYHYTRLESGWRLTHHIIAEQKLGRALRPDERVYFVDNNRENLDIDNIEVRKQGTGSKRRAAAQLDAKIQELIDKKQQLLNET